ncbi:MAG: hypothetical protein WBI29_01960 [Candidatus Saccharimonadales bacterium]
MLKINLIQINISRFIDETTLKADEVLYESVNKFSDFSFDNQLQYSHVINFGTP